MLLAVLVASSASAARAKVVVIGISASNDSLKPVAESISEQVLTELGHDERLEVIGTSDVQAILGIERQKQLLGCTDVANSCLIEISSALGAPWLVSGSLAKLGKAMRMDLKLIRSRDGKVVFRDGRTFKDESDVFEAVSALVTKLVKAIDIKEGASTTTSAPPPVVVEPARPAVTDVAPPPPPVVETRAAPAGNLGKWVLGGAGVVGVLAGAGMLIGGFVSYDATKMNIGTFSFDGAKKEYESANGLKVAGAAVGGAGVAALVAAIVWFVMPSDAAPTTFIGVSPNGVLVHGGFP